MLGSHTEMPVFPIGGEAKRKWGGKAPQLLINSWDGISTRCLGQRQGKKREISALLPSQGTEEWWKAMKQQCVGSTPAERLEVDTACSSLQLQRRKWSKQEWPPFSYCPLSWHMYSKNHPGPRCPVISGRKAELPGWGTMKSSRIDLWPLFSLYFLPSPAELQNVEPPKASSPSFGQFTSVPSLNKRLMITFLHYTERGIISIVTTYLHLLRIRKQTNKGEISLK